MKNQSFYLLFLVFSITVNPYEMSSPAELLQKNIVEHEINIKIRKYVIKLLQK